jgi:hypothetical protein
MHPEQMALLIPIFIVFGCSALPVIYLLLRYLRRRRLFDLYHEERMAAIAKGVEMPPLPDALLYEGGRARQRAPGRTLLKGLLWLFVGIGLFAAMRVEERHEAIFALVPVAVGCAYLVYYMIEGRKAVASTPDHSDPTGPLPAVAQS